MRTLSLRWALLTGLLLAVVAAYDVRPAYLCVLLMAMYFVIIAVSDRDRRLLLRRTLLGAAAGAVFIGTQAFWLVPLLTYHGSAGLPIPQAPNFNVISLGHGLAAVDAFWTGGNPAQLVQAPLNPAYMILPLLAFTPMLMRRLRPEVLWLLVAALLFAFFAKTDNAPLGRSTIGCTCTCPVGSSFARDRSFSTSSRSPMRSSSPSLSRARFEWASANHIHLRARLVRRGAALGLVGVVALSAWSVVVLQSGSLGSTTSPTPEPTSFSALSQLLAADSRPGPVLWFGQPLIGDNIRNHHFLVASPTHPAVNLTGKFAGTRVNQRDPFQLYCADNLIAYCYLDSPLFPYLAQMAGAGYIVVPGGQAVGSLPPGITRQWLQQQMSAMFGAPTVLGSGSTTLLVWRLSSTDPAVTTAPAIAVVDSGTWATTEALPALEALGLPAAYRESFDNNQYPVAPANLPDAVAVMPRFDNACQSDVSGAAAVMVQSPSGSLPSSIQTTVGSGAQTLQLLTPRGLPRAAGWGVYGPFSVASGNTTVSITATSSQSLTPGPCVSWSSLTAAALDARANAVTAIRLELVGADHGDDQRRQREVGGAASLLRSWMAARHPQTAHAWRRTLQSLSPQGLTELKLDARIRLLDAALRAYRGRHHDPGAHRRGMARDSSAAPIAHSWRRSSL